MTSAIDSDDLRRQLDDALAHQRTGELAALIAQFPAEDLTHVLPELDRGQLADLFRAMGDVWLAGVVSRLDPIVGARLLLKLTEGQAADVLEEMAPDEATDVVGELTPIEYEDVLQQMDGAEAAEIRDLLAYPPESAGGRMTPKFVALRESMTVAEAGQYLRTVAAGAEIVYYLYVVDAAGRLVGVTTLRDILLSPPSRRVEDFTQREVVAVDASEDQAEAARVLREHGFLAVPVVGPDRRLLGIITADDVADVLEQEATEDMYRMAGIGVKEHATSPMLESARRRVPWLAFNMAWSLGSAFVITIFQDTIEKATVLAVFMPVIAGQAGNSGIQTATIVIRSLALGDVTPRDTLRVLAREWGVGLIKGGLFGVSLALIAWVWKGSLALGVIAGAALFLNVAVVASTTGVILPMTLSRLGVDPATIAGVFDTMLSDLMGNLIYLGLATLLIAWLLR